MIKYPLGLKYPPKIDKRTIPLKAILRKERLPALPDYFSVDESVGGVNDRRMFGNDEYGNCAEAMKAHHLLRFEKFEQGVQIYISDQEVIDQYFEETGGQDTGLDMLDTLKWWRKTGFISGGRTYKIYAFASVDESEPSLEEVRYCIYLLNGIDFGMAVYKKDMEQFNAGEPWTLTGNDGQLLGYHGVYGHEYGIPTPEPEPPPDPPSDCFTANSIVKGLNFASKILGRRTYIPTPRRSPRLVGYEKDDLICTTWGRPQRMSKDFWLKRVFLSFGIVDSRDDWLEDSPVDVEKLDSYLEEITG
jgi:hypothetical protein